MLYFNKTMNRVKLEHCNDDDDDDDDDDNNNNNNNNNNSYVEVLT